MAAKPIDPPQLVARTPEGRSWRAACWALATGEIAMRAAIARAEALEAKRIATSAAQRTAATGKSARQRAIENI